MPNNYFEFKQFTIQQQNCSMKVCTDACLFGAWVAQKINELSLNVTNCLDIGAGTGLLTLMLAQKLPHTNFEAVEIEQNAFEQCKENFQNSLWATRLQIMHTDVKKFQANKKYELIISNPPFFENDLRSGEKNKNIAKHNDGLHLIELIQFISQNIAPSGISAILIPFSRTTYFENILTQNHFFVKEKTLVKQSTSHNFFRAFYLVTKEKNTTTNQIEIVIKNEQGNYTDEFIFFLEDYYLNL